MKLKYLPLIFIAILSLFFFLLKTINDKKKYRYSYNGTIFQIDEGRGGNHYYYKKNKYFTDDDFFKERFGDKIKIGDSIIKRRESKKLTIYRKNKKGIYELKYEFNGT